MFSEFSSMVLIEKKMNMLNGIAGSGLATDQVFPGGNIKMREVAFPMNMKMTDVNRAKLEPEDMKDFRVPKHIFCEYANIMKGFNKEC